MENKKMTKDEAEQIVFNGGGIIEDSNKIIYNCLAGVSMEVWKAIEFLITNFNYKMI